MKSFYQSLLYKDKTFNNPIMGEVNCAALCSKYEECHQIQKASHSHHDECV
jgi:hypothetical protein